MMWTWCKYVSHEQCKDPVIKGVTVRAALGKLSVRVKPTLVAGFLRPLPVTFIYEKHYVTRCNSYGLNYYWSGFYYNTIT